MIEHTLREGSSWGKLSQVLGESEWFSDRQVGFHNNKRCSLNGLFTNNNTSSLCKALIDTSHSIIRGLDFAHENWLLESWFSSKHGSIVDSSSSGDDLTTTSVDSISMKSNIQHVESNTSHILLCHHWLFSGPLEGSFHRISDFVQVLHSLGLINEEVGTRCFWTEAPNLDSFVLIPFVFFSEESVSFFLVHLWCNCVTINGSWQFITKRSGLDVESVMLVWWFSKTDLGTGGVNCLFVCDDWVRFLDFNLSIFVH